MSMLVEHEDKDRNARGVWLSNARFGCSMQMCFEGSHAYFAVYDLNNHGVGHQVAIGVGNDGRPFLQAATKDEIEIVDLLDLVRTVKELKKKLLSSDTLDEIVVLPVDSPGCSRLAP